jgi:hypothetical protein
LYSIYLGNHGKKDFGNKIMKWTTLTVVFLVPVEVLFLLIFSRISNVPMDLHYHVYAYYISVMVCSAVLYSNKQLILFYIKNIIVSFFIPFGLYGITALIHPSSETFLHPALILCVGGIQLVILNLFKIKIVHELDVEKERAEKAEARFKELMEQYSGIASGGFDGVVVISPDLKVTYINEAALNNEYGRNQVLDNSVTILFDKWFLNEKEKLHMTNEITNCINDKKTLFGMFARQDGRMLVFFTPLVDSNGNINSVSINIRRV